MRWLRPGPPFVRGGLFRLGAGLPDITRTDPASGSVAATGVARSRGSVTEYERSVATVREPAFGSDNPGLDQPGRYRCVLPRISDTIVTSAAHGARKGHPARADTRTAPAEASAVVSREEAGRSSGASAPAVSRPAGDQPARQVPAVSPRSPTTDRQYFEPYLGSMIPVLPAVRVDEKLKS